MILTKKALYVQVYELVKERIMNNELKPGERIVESDLKKELKISTSPIREGLRMLEQDGLLVLTPAGLIVVPINFQEIQEIFACRMALEPYAAGLTAERIKKTDISQLRTYIEQAGTHKKNNDFKKMCEVNSNFHKLIYQNCGNKRLIAMIEKNNALIEIFRYQELNNWTYREQYLEEHEHLVDILETGNVDAVRKALYLHIKNDSEFFAKNFPLEAQDL